MTVGELRFAILVNDMLAQCPQPELRQIVVQVGPGLSVVNEGPVMGCKWVWDVVQAGKVHGEGSGGNTKDREPRGVGMKPGL